MLSALRGSGLSGSTGRLERKKTLRDPPVNPDTHHHPDPSHSH